MEIIPSILSVTLLLLTWYHVNGFPIRWHSPLILWNRQVRVGAKTLRVSAGKDLRIACDGKVAEATFDPYLSWYGPDRRLIAQDRRSNRLRIESSSSPNFLKLHIGSVSHEDSGLYICIGWFAREQEWKVAYFNLIVVDTLRTTTTTETTVPVTTEIKPTEPPTLQTTQTTVREQTTLTTLDSTQTTVSAITDIEQTTESIAQSTNQTEVLNFEQTTMPDDNCSTPRFLCGSGECFDGLYRCDGFPDCVDGSDEDSCVGLVCTEGNVACADGSTCVPRGVLCNGAQDCPDGSDESSKSCPDT